MWSGTEGHMNGSRRQRGYGLLLGVLVLAVGAAAFLFGTRTPGPDPATRARQQAAVELRHAVTALRIYSLADADRPGSLPCPDFTGDGTTDINCLSSAGNVYLERLPWKTLDLSRGAARLWYAMDSDFRDNDTAEPVNVHIEGSLTLDDVPGHAAFILDPGEPLAGQTGRRTAGETIEDYFDVPENTDGDADFLDCKELADCNDRIVVITVDELFELVQRRVMEAIHAPVQQFLQDYLDVHGRLPFAAEFGSDDCAADNHRGHLPVDQGTCASADYLDPGTLPPWVQANAWLDAVVYHVDSSCTSAPCAPGDLQIDDQGGLTVVLALAGSPLAGQSRTGAGLDADDYLESGTAGGAYLNRPLSDNHNDLFRGQ